jgi:thiamine-monophosphate kinase
MAERSLIAAIQARLGEAGGRVLVGPGDDAAVVRADGVSVTSIDTVVDGVHFELATHSPGDVGHKALATALSDIAAMGAEPGEAYVSVVLPERFAALEMVDAMHELAERANCTLAGGDVVSGPVLTVTVAVTGWAASEDELVLRSGAKPGDLVGVTGELGGSGLGLRMLRDPGGGPRAAGRGPVLRHLRPEPRLAEGRALAAAGVSAMIDVSDGLATDAAHIAEASGVAIEVRLAQVPAASGTSPEQAASDGDDYELLFTAPPERRAAVEAAAGVSWLGDVRPGAGVVFRAVDGSAVELTGFEHRG